MLILKRGGLFHDINLKYNGAIVITWFLLYVDKFERVLCPMYVISMATWYLLNFRILSNIYFVLFFTTQKN